MKTPLITVEFYGVPRKRAGRSELTVSAANVRDLLRAIRSACPELGDVCDADGALSRHYLLSLDGERFLAGGDAELVDGVHLLLLSADPGG